jgi:hypothetical protein
MKLSGIGSKLDLWRIAEQSLCLYRPGDDESAIRSAPASICHYDANGNAGNAGNNEVPELLNTPDLDLNKPSLAAARG